MDIRIRGLRKTFGASPALHGVDLEIASGELIGLLGPSGSGKTTLLRSIAGLETPSDGAILFGEDDMAGRSVQERRVGFVFQNYALFRHMTVAQNIGYGLRIRPRASRPPRLEIDRRVRDLLDLVQLSGYERRLPNQLSGGQRQRVALARALAVEPRVLLLDEPFGALDAQVRKDLRKWLRELHDRTGHTTVFVTHDQDEALELSDRVAILNRGRMEQIGSPDEIYDRPANPFVFNFIGDANRVPAEIVGGYLRLGDATLGRSGAAERDCDLYFRPEHGKLNPNSSGPRGSIIAVRRIGARKRADIRLDVGGALVVIDLPPGVRAEPGERTGLEIEQFSVFSNGRRVPILSDASAHSERRGTN